MSKYLEQFDLDNVPCSHVAWMLQYNKQIGTPEGDERIVLDDLRSILDQRDSIAQSVRYLIERIHHSDPHEFGYDPLTEMTFTPEGWFAIY